MGDIAAVGPTGKGLDMGQDVAIFRSRARPPDRIYCIGGGDSDRRFAAKLLGRQRHQQVVLSPSDASFPPVCNRSPGLLYRCHTHSGCALAQSYRQEPA